MPGLVDLAASSRFDTAVDIGLTMSTHGLLTRDERDFFLQRLGPDEMRPVELAEHAERLGYHSVWFSDHVVMGRTATTRHTANESGTRAYPDQPVMLDVVACMGAIAARTERIRMASSVHIAPYRHPLNSAHQFATIDVLSAGRLIVGVGSGWDTEEFAAVGADYGHRGRSPRSASRSTRRPGRNRGSSTTAASSRSRTCHWSRSRCRSPIRRSF